MKEAIVAKGNKVTIHEVPIPKPAAGQVLIKVIFSGSNPKDWKLPYMIPPHNSGDDIAGTVEEAGANVVGFKKGDRVAAFHEITKPHGSFAEYAIAWAYTTFHLPAKISFEEGSTIPLAAMTAAVGLYLRLGLPAPWTPTLDATPLIVYGGSGAVGAYAIKLAQLSNIHPIIAVAGAGADYVETLITRSEGDTIIDYRKGNDAVISGLKDALKGSPCHYAFDAVSEHNSFQNLSKVLAPESSNITVVLPGKDYSDIPQNISHSTTSVGTVHQENLYEGTPMEEEFKKAGIKTGTKEFGFIYFNFFTRGLAEGWFSGHPYEVVPGGLGGVEKALTDLQNGKASAKKFIFNVPETK
ncbi:zinc-binding oxidoreductase-like protein ToxD [Calycina marina]|uniref:Zinc-binding oxidoreductase-like protein ToxD n=1 Tax=Calycina marina TaxID=1763456 RepID=A0A9P7ZBE2_9HELO|nr:zinc-binding oxidoreductase-like protein ToxD [Calycina marina]